MGSFSDIGLMALGEVCEKDHPHVRLRSELTLGFLPYLTLVLETKIGCGMQYFADERSIQEYGCLINGVRL